MNFERDGSLKVEEEKTKIETIINSKESQTIEEYVSGKKDIQDKEERIGRQLSVLKDQLLEVRNRLGIDSDSNTDQGILDLEKELEVIENEKIKASANYPGDWTLLLRERMFDPISKQKFIETRAAAMLNMKPGEVPENKDGISLIKETGYQKYYQEQIDEYDANVERIFNSTNISEASDFGKTSEKLGKGEIGFEGAVFADARKLDGLELSNREKNIIESHEKGHGLRDFVSEDSRDFRQSIDLEVIRQKDRETGKREIGYLSQAEEIAERMAQLKNYFGMKADEKFTKQHLNYAREHYLKDIDLDNNMSTFFAAITPMTEDKFIETINKYPL